jgi:hypothetical protein
MVGISGGCTEDLPAGDRASTVVRNAPEVYGHVTISIMVGKKKTIYVTGRDADLWDRAATYARDNRLSMSALLLMALERFLADETG